MGTRSAARRRPCSSTATAALVDGLVLWAVVLVGRPRRRRTDRGSLSYGTLDAGVPTFTDPDNVAKLGPATSATTVIEGGNHEQMGWYTGQPNDPPATISRQDQQDRIVAATVELLTASTSRPLE